ncbi:MAG: CehA/McbA family metallohydrolase [Kofleriaceae bacterium]
MTRSSALACMMLAALSACGRGDKSEKKKPPPGDAKPAPRVSTTTFAPRVTANGTPVAARVLLIDAKGEPLHMGNLDVYGKRQGAAACAIASTVIASYDGIILARGEGDIPVGADACVPSPAIPYGRYKVWAWRGIEYELWEGEVDLSADRGRVELAIPLERAWTPVGTLAADLHVHAQASLDSLVPNPQRVVAQVAAGIQVIALSDHNTNGDLDAEIAALELEDTVASIASNEVTSDFFHFGVYPVVVDKTKPHGGALGDEVMRYAGLDAMFQILKKIPGNPILQVNHPRFRSVALFDNTGWDGVAWPPPFPTTFDAVEVLSGYTAFNVPGDRRFDDSVRDFFTLTDHGVLVAPLGNSDTHDLNWVLDGTSRNYVFMPEDKLDLKTFDEEAFIGAIRKHRVVATTGPWLSVLASSSESAKSTVGPGATVRPKDGAVWLDITLAQAKFVKTERIRITIGGVAGPKLVETIDVPDGARTHHWAGKVAIDGKVDTWIAVTADGDTALPLAITGSYQKDRWDRPGVTPYAIAAPILVDTNRDGAWIRTGPPEPPPPPPPPAAGSGSATK